MTAVMPVIVLPAASSADAEPSLNVFTELPTFHEGQPQEWVWTKLLSFSAQDLHDIKRVEADHPWRWILFACGVVVGTKLGSLSTSKAADPQFSLTAPGVQFNVVYFHVPSSERPTLRAVEPNLCTNKLGSGTSTSHRENDVSIVAERDLVCVCSDFPLPLCQGAHLIPHVKGDSYINTLTNGVVKEIDSMRNIILLQINLHFILGKTFAIMPKPNFAYSEAATAELRAAEVATSWEPHVLRAYPITTRPSCRVPQDLKKWPPEILFEQVYAAAVLHTFHCTDSNEGLSYLSKSYYGDRGPMNSLQRQVRALREKEAQEAQIQQGNNDERDSRALRREGGSAHDDALEEIAASQPVWFSALDAETKETWLNVLWRQQEAARAAHRERVAQWRLDSAVQSTLP